MIFFFNDTATTEIYTLSLHDALPISRCSPPRQSPLSVTSRSPRAWRSRAAVSWSRSRTASGTDRAVTRKASRSEEHTSELQSRQYLVCRLLLEKKKKIVL